MMALTNIHRRDLDPAWLMDALVHESIHSLLYNVESLEPFYVSANSQVAFTAESPWTGKKLYLHSFVHACFVWFGLWSFWSVATDSGHCRTLPTDFFRDRSRRGFGVDLLARLGAGREEVSQHVLQAIARMEDKVVNETRLSV
jgi:hypothetical protein